MRAIILLALVLCFNGSARAQSDSGPARPGTTLTELGAGYTGFADDGIIHHTGINGAVRVHVTPRISIGGELSYQLGPGLDRDVMPLVVMTADLRQPCLGEVGRVEPFVLVGAGIIGHTSEYEPSAWPTVTWGGGARVWLAERVYVTADARLGWPSHLRIVSGVGMLLR
jgi:hypothetical protein